MLIVILNLHTDISFTSNKRKLYIPSKVKKNSQNNPFNLNPVLKVQQFSQRCIRLKCFQNNPHNLNPILKLQQFFQRYIKFIYVYVYIFIHIYISHIYTHMCVCMYIYHAILKNLILIELYEFELFEGGIESIIFYSIWLKHKNNYFTFQIHIA